MNKANFSILLLASTFAWAGSVPNPADYTVNVRVTRSHLDQGQKLNVVIDGKKYELVGGLAGGLLSLGDYKAKLVRDNHKTAYESDQEYEFLFSDRKVKKFWVIGETE